MTGSLEVAVIQPRRFLAARLGHIPPPPGHKPKGDIISAYVSRSTQGYKAPESVELRLHHHINSKLEMVSTGIRVIKSLLFDHGKYKL